jgi:hypothetical protein
VNLVDEEAADMLTRREPMTVKGICSGCERRRSRGGEPSRAQKIVIGILTTYALGVILPDFGRLNSWKERVASYKEAKAEHERDSEESDKSHQESTGYWYPLGIPGFQANNDGRVTKVDDTLIKCKERESGEAVAHGVPVNENCLQVGDLLDLERTPATDRRAVNQFVLVRFGQPINLVMKPRLNADGTIEKPARSITIDPAPEQQSWVSFFSLLAAQFAACGFIFFSLWLVWRRPAYQTWGLFLYSLWFNSGQYFVWYANLPEAGLRVFNYVQAFFEALGLTGILLFALYFPEKPGDEPRKVAWRLLIVPFVLLLSVRLWTLRGYMEGKPSENAYFVWYFLTLVIFITMGSLLWYSYMTQPVNRPQIRMVGLGATAGLAAWLIADTHETIGFPSWLPIEWVDFFYAMSVLLPLAIFTAIRRFRVIDVRFAISRAALVVVLTGMLIAFLHPTAHKYFESRFHGLEEWWLPFGVSLSVGLILLESRLHGWIERLFFHDWHRTVRDARRVAEELAHREDFHTRDVNERVLHYPVNALELKCGAVYKRTGDGLFALERSYGLRIDCQNCGKCIQSKLAPLAGDDRIFKRLVKKHESHPRRRRRWFRRADRLPIDLAAPDAPPGYTTPAHAAAILRWHDQKRTVDRIVVFGPHAMDQDLDLDEIKLLDKLAIAAGSAYLAAEFQELKDPDDTAPM